MKHLVFKSKKKLKGKGVAITESLTKRCMEALTKAKEDSIMLGPLTGRFSLNNLEQIQKFDF